MSEPSQDSRANLAPVSAGLATCLGGIETTIQLGQPGLVPVGIGDAVEARDDPRGDRDPLILRQCKDIMKQLLGGSAHAIECTSTSEPHHELHGNGVLQRA